LEFRLHGQQRCDCRAKAIRAGEIEVQIDGQTRATVESSTAGEGNAQQRVWEVADLTDAKHSIAIINRGPGPVALDALIVG
jgi:hypothetical protein